MGITLHRHLLNYTGLFLPLIFCFACVKEKRSRFTLIDSSESGISFRNTISESDSLNILVYEYMYNGGGVGIGDFNNDGLSDIVFSGNMVSSEIYLNKGNFKFQNITKVSGLTTGLWCTGVSVVDINADGLSDIQISTANPSYDKSSPNLFFINKGLNEDGIPQFEEMAAKMGLASEDYSTHAAFLDYDQDGDLDMYLLTNSLENYSRNSPIGQRNDGTGKSVDKLFRNEGIKTNGLPWFNDVSKEAGITSEGWGLGVIVNDINLDGLSDLYIANDFLSNDLLYVNQGNGTFKNEIASRLKHQEYNGMGVDMGDINNDGLNEIVVTDMMPEDNLRQKTMFSNTGYDKFFRNIQMNYQPQYVRNVLQLNNGNGTYSDIGYLSGIYATDWSWSVLLADLDNDTYQDIFITNGYPKDITDLDFISYSKESSMFGTDEVRLKKAIKAMRELEGVKKPNLIFANKGDYTFENRANEWGMSQNSYSNGAAYADFDNDGDLDIVTNNINDPAFLYRNHTMELDSMNHHFLRVKLQGNSNNPWGLGAKVQIHYQGNGQYKEHQVQRGYQSTVENVLHFGLGSLKYIDSLTVIWPGGKGQQLKNIKTDQLIVLEEQESSPVLKATNAPSPVFMDITDQSTISFMSKELDFIDFKTTVTLPHKFSQEGPGIAIGDINQDGNEDFVVGGSANSPAIIFFQQTNGSFLKDSLPSKPEEDLGLLLFDADNDKDLDLYCVSGSSEYGDLRDYFQNRLYKNDGKGKFFLDENALPDVNSAGSSVVASDFDHDGDLDLFIGGRLKPEAYPLPAESYIFKNNGSGQFSNVTASVAPLLMEAGLVTSALWTDFDNDTWTDLLIMGEWMAPTFLKNEYGKTFRKLQNEDINNLTGWWNSVTGGDFDNDGDIDYVLGNLGLNSVYKASADQPVSIHASDFDNNGSIDPILSRFVEGEEYISHPRETLTDQIVSLKKKLTRYSDYGKSDIKQLLKEKLNGALVYQAKEFETVYLQNLGKGNFKKARLPRLVQMAPAFGMLADDINDDGNLDLLVIGNSYSSDVLTGLYDAGTGYVLIGNGLGDFHLLNSSESGFFVDGDAKSIAKIFVPDGSLILVGQNKNKLKVFKNIRSKNQLLFNPELNDAFAEIRYKDGRKRKHEFYYGTSYLSQSSRLLNISAESVEVVVTDYLNKRRKVSSNSETSIVRK